MARNSGGGHEGFNSVAAMGSSQQLPITSQAGARASLRFLSHSDPGHGRWCNVGHWIVLELSRNLAPRMPWPGCRFRTAPGAHSSLQSSHLTRRQTPSSYEGVVGERPFPVQLSDPPLGVSSQPQGSMASRAAKTSRHGRGGRKQRGVLASGGRDASAYRFADGFALIFNSAVHRFAEPLSQRRRDFADLRHQLRKHRTWNPQIWSPVSQAARLCGKLQVRRSSLLISEELCSGARCSTMLSFPKPLWSTIPRIALLWVNHPRTASYRRTS